MSIDARSPKQLKGVAVCRFQRIRPLRQGGQGVRHELLTYEADGLTMRSQLFVEPAAHAQAGVLVFPEAFGLGHHAIARAERLAGMGYAALACDLHGEGRLVDDLQEALGLLQPLYAEPSRTRARAKAALDILTARKEVDAARIAAIGFCFGGTMALELARSGADIRAVVGFHSGLKTTAPRTAVKAIKARVLVCIGADDPFIPPEERAGFEAEMRDGGVDWQMHLYGGTVHSFTIQDAAKRDMPEAIRYDAEADTWSWAAMQQLFSETLGAAGAS
jgi:dienelactone hydrolase